jgi:unsaturated rhamnogalacturonyl hydrolase
MNRSGTYLINLLMVISITAFGQKKSAAENPGFITSPRETLMMMRNVADWQINSGLKREITYWGNAAFFAGVSELATLVNDDHYFNYLMELFDDVQWAIGSRKLHADDIAILQIYCELYELYGNKKFINDGRRAAERIISMPLPESLDVSKSSHDSAWNWCDALFMAPPALSRLYRVTGEKKYLDGMDRLYWHTIDYLYNPEDKLVFRDSKYFDDESPNGEHVYWSRGNGWVMGGLVRILQDMPADYPSRSRYESLFREISKRLALLLTPDGTWHTNLLDPDHFPGKEISGTTFFVYALTYGVNEDLLEKEIYLPVIKRAWNACVEAVHDNGMIGYIQPIGAAPGYAAYEFTESYGAGSFILAGSEILKLMLGESSGIVNVTVKNPIQVNRRTETVEIDWNDLKAKGAKPGAIKVIDFHTGIEIASQITRDNKGKPSRLIFQTELAAGTKKYYIVKKGIQDKYTPMVYGRIVPERYDDLAWENNLIAYRIYGQALIPVDGPSGGIDVWKKRTNALIIDRWYARGDYHHDHGEGNDSYKVGPSLGAGGISLIDEEGLALHENYKTATIIDSGPIRFKVALTFEPQELEGHNVSMTKVLSLDANSYLNKWEVQFAGKNEEIPVAVGIIRRNRPGDVLMDEQHGVLSYYEPENLQDNGLSGRDKGNGRTGIGVIMPGMALMGTIDDHYVARSTALAGDPFVYYSGASWNKAQYKWRMLPVPLNNEDWIDYLYLQKQQLVDPLIVKYE